MYLLALWPRDCSDDSYIDSKYNRHCDATIHLTVRAAKLCKRGSVEVHNYETKTVSVAGIRESNRTRAGVL